MSRNTAGPVINSSQEHETQMYRRQTGSCAHACATRTGKANLRNTEERMTIAELATAYDTYTNEFEVSNALETEVLNRTEPTTTVLTTSMHCGNIED
jgi:hypothetical protein